MTSPYRVPLEQLEEERVARTDQVVLHGDGTVPAEVTCVGGGGGDAPDGDGD